MHSGDLKFVKINGIPELLTYFRELVMFREIGPLYNRLWIDCYALYVRYMIERSCYLVEHHSCTLHR